MFSNHPCPLAMTKALNQTVFTFFLSHKVQSYFSFVELSQNKNTRNYGFHDE